MKNPFTILSEKIHNYLTDKFLEAASKGGAQNAMQKIEQNTRLLRDQLDNKFDDEQTADQK